jgi:predicted kinase
VLLGSVATGKYVEPLQGVFGERLLFPTAFVGRGDMSRGGLLLRCADAGLELDYAPIAGAVRHGARAAKLPPRRASTPAPAPELAILIGFPGAGKSTFYAEHLAETHVHVSKDAMPRSADKRARQRRLLEAALRAGRSVAVDNVNATRSERAEPIAIAAAAGARVVGYWLDAPPRICVGRNRERGGAARVPPVAIFAAAKRFEPPTEEEGFAALWRVRVTGAREASAFEITPVGVSARSDRSR